MLPVSVYSGDEALWRDAARRLHRATLTIVPSARTPAAACSAVVFAGTAQADPAAIERELAAGRHVLVVAEPCLARESLKSLAAEAAKRGVRLSVVNPDRWLGSRQTVKKQLGGPLGSPELLRIHRWQTSASAAGPAPLGLPPALVAEIEQALWLAGRPLETVFALEHRASASGDAGRFLQVHLGFCPGMALIDYDSRLPTASGEAAAGYRSLSVIGSSGSAQTDDQANAQLAYRGGAPQAIQVGEGVAHLAKLIDDFAAKLANGAATKDTTSDGLDDWLAVADAVAAVKRSLADKQAVKLAAAERKAG